MVLDIDDALDHYGGPQASTARRRFGKAAQPDGVEKEEMPLDQEMHEQPVKGERATFVVQIQYRQNATWQGQVLWAEKDERKAFRSALELLKLIDSALDEPNTT